MAEEQTIARPVGQVVSAAMIETRDWFAWNNVDSPAAPRFHLTGEVYVPNPGVDAVLVPRVSPEMNPTVLLLDVVPKQAPGLWPSVFVWAPARCDKVPGYFRHVRILFAGEVIADVPVQDVH